MYEHWIKSAFEMRPMFPCFYLFIYFNRMSIVNIVAREILDSRGNPTVEVDLHTDKGLEKINSLV